MSDPRDIRTSAYVLRRTNYGEADRILNLITKDGKFSAVAKGVRKEKSKLAGSVEMFSLIDINLHLGHSDLATVTGAKMLEHYANILKDFSRLELAGQVLKKVNSLADSAGTKEGGAECFRLVDETLRALNSGISLPVIEAWFYLNYARVSGEEVNLYRDSTGAKLSPEKSYSWDFTNSVLVPRSSGEIKSDQIKLMRLILTSGLTLVSRVVDIENLIPPILEIAKSVV